MSTQRMSDERLKWFSKNLPTTGRLGAWTNELYQAVKAERTHSDHLEDIANECADQRDDARAVVKRVAAVFRRAACGSKNCIGIYVEETPSLYRCDQCTEQINMLEAIHQQEPKK